MRRANLGLCGTLWLKTPSRIPAKSRSTGAAIARIDGRGHPHLGAVKCIGVYAERVDPAGSAKRLEAEAVSELVGLARFKIREGKLDEFKRLAAQSMEIVRTRDRGTLQYATYFNDDQSECVVVERYRDSEAAIEHAENLGDLMGAILGTITLVHGEVLGEPSAELRAKLASSDVPQLFTPYQSM